MHRDPIETHNGARPVLRLISVMDERSTDVQLTSPLLSIAPGPTRVLCSSKDLGWRGLILEKHFSAPGERASAHIDCNVISMSTGASFRFGYREPGGRFVECQHRRGAIVVTPSGDVPEMRLHTATEFVHCGLEENFTRSVAEESGCQKAPHPVFRPGILDKTIRRILELLLEEITTEARLGSLFVDSLAHALATRYLQLDPASSKNVEPRVSSLPSRVLDRVLGKIESNLDADLSLESLAKESGYSRAHFLRMFQAATGLTPHRYVVNLRIRRAQERLRQKDRIIDVAASCGFSSQAHMTTLFRQCLAMTPAEFRRNA
jgi:AraC family transcriptional regulator